MTKVLIVSGNGDAHAINMGKVLEKKGIEHYFLLTDEFPFKSQLNLERANRFIKYAGTRINLDEELAIWNRRIFSPDFPAGYPKELEELAREECKRTVSGMMVTHPGLVVNSPGNNNSANNKLEQLQRAESLGWYIPDTIITNDAESANAFYDRHKGDVVFKMQKLPIVSIGNTNKTIMTNRVKDKTDFDKIQNTPVLFQERIEKEYEIRLTVIGEKMFPIAIYSQASDISRDDFRRYDFDKVKYELKDLPENIKDKALKLVRSYGLHYAAIDIIKTPDNSYVFLEINPNGQYLWTEEMSGAKITEELADYLSK